jgi:hypothetical protein
MGATFYSRIVLSEILNSIRVIPKADCKLWQSLKEYGIAKTTRRGCRAGAFKHRHITTVTGFGRYSFVPEWQIGCEQWNFQSSLKIQTNAITQINQARRSHVYGTVLGNYNNLIHIKCHPRLPSIVNYSQQPLRIRQIRVGEITIAFGDKMESEKEQGWADKGGGGNHRVRPGWRKRKATRRETMFRDTRRQRDSFCREDHEWLITTHIYTHSEGLVRIVNYSQQPLRIRQIRVGEITIARARW